MIEFIEAWQKATQQFTENFIKTGQDIKSNFDKVEVVKNLTEPTEIFQSFLDTIKNSSENQKKIMDNNIKFQKAFIAYNQALVDMMEIANENAKLLNKK